MVAVHHLMCLALWRLKVWAQFSKWHGPSEPFLLAQWVKIPSAFGPCVRESTGDWPLQRGHTTLTKPMSFLSSLQLILHPPCLPPHQFLQSFSTYHATGGLGVCGPDVFPKLLKDYFSSVFTEQMFPFTLPPLHPPQLLKPFSALESTSCCCCVFDQETMSRNKRIPHWRLFGKRAPGCVCVPPPFVPITVVSRCSQLTEWLFFLWPLPPRLHPLPLPQANHNVPKILVSFPAWIHSSPLLHPELCLPSLGNLCYIHEFAPKPRLQVAPYPLPHLSLLFYLLPSASVSIPPPTPRSSPTELLQINHALSHL